MEKLLSIIVLNYNRLKYTKQTVKNLISKTTVRHEFIFVDQGSVDGTRKYLLSLKDKTNAESVKYVFNSRNLGVAGGRNKGILLSSGDYIMTIDDDIIVPEDYDKMLIDVCDKIPNLGVTGVCVEKKKFAIINKNGIDVMLKKDGNLNGACLCFNRKILKSTIGYFYAGFYYGAEDIDLYIRLREVGLKSFYIRKRGREIDKNLNKRYLKLKRKSHKAQSKQLSCVGKRERIYRKTKKIFIPYNVPVLSNDTVTGSLFRTKKRNRGYKLLIIIVAEKNDEYLENTIDSIKKQRFKECKYRIISKNKIGDYENDRILFFDTIKDTINHIIFDIIPKDIPDIGAIMFLNAGDVLKKGVAKRVLKFFGSNQNTAVGCVNKENIDNFIDYSNKTTKGFSVNQSNTIGQYYIYFNLDYLYVGNLYDKKTNNFSNKIYNNKTKNTLDTN